MKHIRTLLIAAALIMTSMQALADDCIGNVSELGDHPELRRLFAGFNGPENLQGNWRLSGLAGSFVNARLSIESRPTGLWTKYNDEPEEQINVCVHEDNQSLKIVVLQPEAPENRFVYVRPVEGRPNQIQISAHTSRWQFMKFRRVGSNAAPAAAP